jgi:hypothetical protein
MNPALLQDVLHSYTLSARKRHEMYETMRDTAGQFEPDIRRYWQEASHGPSSRRRYHIFLKLHAYALENVLKAVLAKLRHEQYFECISGRGAIPSDLHTHDLGKLWESAVGTPPSRREAELLDRLNRSAEWREKYPTSFREEHPCLCGDAGSRNVEGSISALFSETDLALLARLHDKALGKYREVTTKHESIVGRDRLCR